jgi:hypothetical protein
MAQVDTSREDRLLRTALDYIEKNRKGTVEIRFVDEITATPVSGAEVQYRQTSHDFMFSNLFWGDVGKMQQLGLEWDGDVWLSWTDIERTRGVYDFSKPDSTIRWLRQYRQVHIFARFTGFFLDWNYVVSTPPPRPPSFADFDHIDDPAIFARYKDLVYEFVFKVAARYKSTIQAYVTQWEINWPGSAVTNGLSQRPAWTVQQAVEVNKVVSRAIRDADPTAIIMLGTSTAWEGPSPRDLGPIQFTKLCLQSGVDVDVIALEGYPFDGSPSFFYDYVKRLAKLGRPVFIEETGYPSDKPNADEFWVRSWKWHVFNEQVQALWFKYMFTLMFGSKEATGVSVFTLRDQETAVPYLTVFNSMGLFTTMWQPKESAKMLRELMANFTTSGTARTDINGTIAVRGFAGNYTVRVSGYEPVTIHISEGTTEDLTVSLSREKTSEYNDTAKAVESASVALSALRSRDLKTQEAKNLTEAAAVEYELAVASLDRWELDAAQTHAERSQQLANQALQAEAQYQQQQDYLKFSVVLAAMVLIVAVIAVSLGKSRTAPKARKEDAAAS